MTVQQEICLFLYTIIAGIIVGFLYDIFRIKRRTIKTKAFFIYVEDILYWIIVTFLIFAISFYTNDGEAKPYFFVGIILGLIIYYSFFSNIIIKVFIFIIKMLIIPFKAIYKFLEPLIIKINKRLNVKIRAILKEIEILELKLKISLRTVKNFMQKV